VPAATQQVSRFQRAHNGSVHGFPETWNDPTTSGGEIVSASGGRGGMHDSKGAYSSSTHSVDLKMVSVKRQEE